MDSLFLAFTTLTVIHMFQLSYPQNIIQTWLFQDMLWGKWALLDSGLVALDHALPSNQTWFTRILKELNNTLFFSLGHTAQGSFALLSPPCSLPGSVHLHRYLYHYSVQAEDKWSHSQSQTQNNHSSCLTKPSWKSNEMAKHQWQAQWGDFGQPHTCAMGVCPVQLLCWEPHMAPLLPPPPLPLTTPTSVPLRAAKPPSLWALIYGCLLYVSAAFPGNRTQCYSVTATGQSSFQQQWCSGRFATSLFNTILLKQCSQVSQLGLLVGSCILFKFMLQFLLSPELAKDLLPGKSFPDAPYSESDVLNYKDVFSPILFVFFKAPTHFLHLFLRQLSSHKLSFGGKFFQSASNKITSEPPSIAAQFLWHALSQTRACCLARALINILSFTSKKKREQHKEPCISQNGVLYRNSLKNTI